MFFNVRDCDRSLPEKSRQLTHHPLLALKLTLQARNQMPRTMQIRQGILTGQRVYFFARVISQYVMHRHDGVRANLHSRFL